MEGLQYVEHLVVGDYFLKWNCFFIGGMRWYVDFGGVGTKL